MATHLELCGTEGIRDDPARGFVLRDGLAIVSEAAGLGIDLDLTALDRVGTAGGTE